MSKTTVTFAKGVLKRLHRLVELMEDDAKQDRHSVVIIGLKPRRLDWVEHDRFKRTYKAATPVGVLSMKRNTGYDGDPDSWWWSQHKVQKNMEWHGPYASREQCEESVGKYFVDVFFESESG